MSKHCLRCVEQGEEWMDRREDERRREIFVTEMMSRKMWRNGPCTEYRKREGIEITVMDLLYNISCTCDLGHFC